MVTAEMMRSGVGHGGGRREKSGRGRPLHMYTGRRKNPKRIGEMSQAAFLLKARTLGFGVALPWGDSEKYDFNVWPGEAGRMLRVQVKATGRLHGGAYDVQPVYSTRGEG